MQRMARAFYLVASWLTAQIFFVLRPLMFRQNIMGTDGSYLPSVDWPGLFHVASGAEGVFFYHLGSTLTLLSFSWSCASFQGLTCCVKADNMSPNF